MKCVLTGLAIGDALGAPFEEMKHSEIDEINWNGNFLETTIWEKPLAPGQYTDDTLMSLALTKSLIKKRGFDSKDVAQSYLDWFKTKDLRGIGVQTQRALLKIERGLSIFKTGFIANDICGNGSAMRIAPLGVFYKNDLNDILKFASLDATITHNHEDAKSASIVVAYLVSFLFKYSNKINNNDMINDVLNYLINCKMLSNNIIRKINEGQKAQNVTDALNIGTNGTAHETIGTALYCLLTNNNFRDMIMAAVRLGGDTDTRAAIVGAWAGAIFGTEEIPKEYLDNVENNKELLELDRKLWSNV